VWARTLPPERETASGGGPVGNASEEVERGCHYSVGWKVFRSVLLFLLNGKHSSHARSTPGAPPTATRTAFVSRRTALVGHTVRQETRPSLVDRQARRRLIPFLHHHRLLGRRRNQGQQPDDFSYCPWPLADRRGGYSVFVAPSFPPPW